MCSFVFPVHSKTKEEAQLLKAKAVKNAKINVQTKSIQVIKGSMVFLKFPSSYAFIATIELSQPGSQLVPDKAVPHLLQHLPHVLRAQEARDLLVQAQLSGGELVPLELARSRPR